MPFSGYWTDATTMLMILGSKIGLTAASVNPVSPKAYYFKIVHRSGMYILFLAPLAHLNKWAYLNKWQFSRYFLTVHEALTSASAVKPKSGEDVDRCQPLKHVSACRVDAAAAKVTEC